MVRFGYLLRQQSQECWFYSLKKVKRLMINVVYQFYLRKEYQVVFIGFYFEFRVCLFFYQYFLGSQFIGRFFFVLRQCCSVQYMFLYFFFIKGLLLGIQEFIILNKNICYEILQFWNKNFCIFNLFIFREVTIEDFIIRYYYKERIVIEMQRFFFLKVLREGFFGFFQVIELIFRKKWIIIWV